MGETCQEMQPQSRFQEPLPAQQQLPQDPGNSQHTYPTWDLKSLKKSRARHCQQLSVTTGNLQGTIRGCSFKLETISYTSYPSTSIMCRHPRGWHEPLDSAFKGSQALPAQKSPNLFSHLCPPGTGLQYSAEQHCDLCDETDQNQASNHNFSPES